MTADCRRYMFYMSRFFRFSKQIRAAYAARFLMKRFRNYRTMLAAH